MCGQADHRQLFDEPLHIAGTARDHRGRIAALLEFRQSRVDMRQDLKPLGTVEFGDQIGKRQLKIVGALIVGNADIRIVAGQRFVETLAGQIRIVADIPEGVARGDVERPVNIDQRPV